MVSGSPIDVHPVLPVGAILGEGPVWARGALWFVDIKRKRVYKFDPASGSTAQWEAPDQVGWILPEQGGGMIAGVKTGLYRLSPHSGAFALLFDPEPHQPTNRLNDASTDCHGRLWFGTMDDGETRPTGALYRYAGGRCADSGAPRVAITNGPAITPDGCTLFHTDTSGGVIWRMTINDDGSLAAPSQHILIERGGGYPDGSVIDAEGCLWVALFGGWAVRRYDPSGTLMRTIRFPVANVTKIAFGGPDLRTAYATTARIGLDAAALAAQPLAGDLFSFDPGVEGLAIYEAIIP